MPVEPNELQPEDDLSYLQVSMGGQLDAVLIYNLLRTHSYLGPSIEATFKKKKMTAVQFNALLVIRSSGEVGMMMGEIGEQLVVTKSNITGLVDRMEKHGLVTRGQHPDRRATVVQLTEAGNKLLDDILPEYTGLLTELTECLDREEKQSLVYLLTKLRRELRHRRKGMK